MKQILKYPGSKYKSADWIIRQFPEHHSYLEPFFGSGAILFNKERSDRSTTHAGKIKIPKFGSITH